MRGFLCISAEACGVYVWVELYVRILLSSAGFIFRKMRQCVVSSVWGQREVLGVMDPFPRGKWS